MPRLIVHHIDSLADFRRASGAWDELWQRSEVVLPTARAELVALWCECFAPQADFCAWTVEHDGQLVGALPLVLRGQWLRRCVLPTNCWSSAGDLLIDRRADPEAICRALLAALHAARVGPLCCDTVPGDAERWLALKRADLANSAVLSSERFTINLVRLTHNWEGYWRSRDAALRKQLRRAQQRASRLAPVRLARYDELSIGEVEPLLRESFEIERSGWKGRASSAVLNSPRLWEFYLRQARMLAAWRQLCLTRLECDTRPIAFEYGWRAKGVYCSPKVGYLEEFSHASPGQLLRRLLLEQLHAEGELGWLDFFGPASRATSKWATHHYAIERLIVASDGTLARACAVAYRAARPLLGRLRGAARPPKSKTRRVPPPGSSFAEEACLVESN